VGETGKMVKTRGSHVKQTPSYLSCQNDSMTNIVLIVV